jgi:hypothetical protein
MRVWDLLVLAGGVSSLLGCDLDKRRLDDGSTTCDDAPCDDGGDAPTGSAGATTGGSGTGGAGTGGSGMSGSGMSGGVGGASSAAPGGGVGGSGSGQESGSGSGGASSSGAAPGGAGGTSEPDPGDALQGPAVSSCASELLQNPGFESGVAPWAEFYPGEDPVISSETLSAEQGTRAHDGEYLAWFGGVPDETTRVSQRVSVPDGTLALVVSGYRRFLSRESQAEDFADRMTIRFVRGLDVVDELFAWGNQDASSGAEWEFFSRRIDAAGYVGTELTLELESSTGATPESNFYFDDLSLIAECAP